MMRIDLNGEAISVKKKHSSISAVPTTVSRSTPVTRYPNEARSGGAEISLATGSRPSR
jgi:hypothetical protein